MGVHTGVCAACAMRRRAVRFGESCHLFESGAGPIRGVLFLLAACTMAWAKTGRGMISWVREQIPYMERIEESGPVRAADRDSGMTSVKREFTIRLMKRKSTYSRWRKGMRTVETAIDSGSD